MIKELKYALFLVIIFIFIFFCGKYYFSDEHIKKNYRTIKNIDLKIEKYKNNLIQLKNNTENIIEFPDSSVNKKKKKNFFWDLINQNE